MDKDLANRRRENLRLLLEKRFENNQQKIALATNIRPPSVSQILGNRRSMGDAIARRIENNLLLPRGWMDEPQTSVPAIAGAESIGRHTRARLESEVADTYLERIAWYAQQKGAVAIDSHPAIWTSLGIVRPDLLITFPDHTTAVEIYRDHAAGHQISQAIVDSVRLRKQPRRIIAVLLTDFDSPYQKGLWDALVQENYIDAYLTTDNIETIQNLL